MTRDVGVVLVFLCVSLGAWWAFWQAQSVLRRYRQHFTQAAQHRLGEFFLFVDPGQVWIVQWWLCAVLVLGVWLGSGSWQLSMLAGVGVLVLPRWGMGVLRRQRLLRFERQLPDLLMSLAAALRAGSGMQVALRHIVQQSAAPLSQEFGLMLQEQRMGLAFDEALARLGRRVPSQGTALVVSALGVALHSGGNLAETLERIAATMRARLYMQGRIRALTSQGRMQAWVMAALPIVLALVLNQLDPDAMALLWHTPMGWAVLAVVVVLEISGWVLIRRIVAIDV